MIDAAEIVPNQTVIRTPKNPIKPTGGMAVLRGNLAPRGAVIKHAAATPALLTHTGRAVVFDSLEDLAARGDDPDLDVTADDILVLRNAGPKGAPGMPEAGSFPIPMKLARAGVKDMIRISDARMSGTAFGTIVLHIAPESAVGGPLALVKTGDRITLDVPNRKIELLVPAKELATRKKAWKAPPPHPGSDRGYTGLFHAPCCRPTKAWISTSWDRRRAEASSASALPPCRLVLRRLVRLAAGRGQLLVLARDPEHQSLCLGADHAHCLRSRLLSFAIPVAVGRCRRAHDGSQRSSRRQG